jgi:hypothetical protein
VVLAVVIGLLVAPGLVAQSSGGSQGQGQGSSAPSVSDGEIDTFVSVLPEVNSIQQQMTTETREAMQDSELEQQRIQELYRSRQSGNEPSNAPTEEENQQFDQLMTEIQQIQQQSREEIVQAVEDEGMSFSRFQQIARAIQQDQQLQQQFRQKMQQQQGGGNQGTGS